MATKVIPTKANLIAAKSYYDFALKGYELLDKKRTVLIKEMMDLNKKAIVLQEKIEVAFEESYKALTDATITMGSESIYEISHSIAKEDSYDIVTKSVMGVEIPQIKYKKNDLKTEYSFYQSTTAFDTASIDMHNIRYLIYELAEIETGVFRLAQEIKKTVKRANALEKIQIPKYEKIVKEIEDTLAEKEREDFFRLKKVKDRKRKTKKNKKFKVHS